MSFEWRGDFGSDEINMLHAECFEHEKGHDDWWTQVNRHSLGWVCARADKTLVGFANVAWDGGMHAFLLDTMVAHEFRRQGVATLMVQESVAQVRIAGCEGLHVDFEPHLREFYLEKSEFRSTQAGLIRLRP